MQLTFCILMMSIGIAFAQTVDWADDDFTERVRGVEAVSGARVLRAVDSVDMWLIAGQSNAAGDNGLSDEPMPAELQPIPGDAAFAWQFSKKRWFTGGRHTIADGIGAPCPCGTCVRPGLLPRALHSP